MDNEVLWHKDGSFIPVEYSTTVIKRDDAVVGIEKVTEEDDGIELHFRVQDSGIGMTPEQCGKMFQSFSQADASTTRRPPRCPGLSWRFL